MHGSTTTRETLDDSYDTYILLTECEGRTGRILARGLGSTEPLRRGPYKKDRLMTSPFSCSAASSGLPRLFHVSKSSSKWGPSSPGQELLCVSRRKFANLDLLRIRHFQKFYFRSDTPGTGLITRKISGRQSRDLIDGFSVSALPGA